MGETSQSLASAAESPVGVLPPPMATSLAADLAVAALDMATAFNSGATMWCAAPDWPWHAGHLAVEFVHPVIVGKRALPAVALDSHNLVGSLRLTAAPGDLLVAVSRANEPAIGKIMRRAPAWGLKTIWIGTGERPPAGSADHVLWLTQDLDPSEEARAAYGGGFVLVYHLLWELCHVCFEHPGLLSEVAGSADDCNDEVCVTCSDEGRLAEVVATAGAFDAIVRTPAGLESIDTTLVGQVRTGDLVLVHAGSAVTLIDA
jgi:hypothetical protein